MQGKRICFGMLFLVSGAQSGGQQIHAIGDLPGGDVRSNVTGVTNAGVATGSSRSTNNEFEAYVWTPVSGITGLGMLPGAIASEARSISADGSAVVGESGGLAMRWTVGGGMQPLGSLPNGIGNGVARGVSHDGSVIVGDEHVPMGNPAFEAFRWTEQTGPVSLGVIDTFLHRSRATAVSGDGSVVTGYDGGSNGDAFYWTESAGLVVLGNAGVIDGPRPQAASLDGTVIVGGGAGPEAFRWTESSGMVSLGRYTVNDVSDDGNIIVGSEFFASQHRATLWTETSGWRLLTDVLQQDYGMDLTGWTLNTIQAISPDGLVVAGNGVDPSGNPTGYVVIIPSPGVFGTFALSCLWPARRSRSR